MYTPIDNDSRKIDALVAEKIYGWVWKPWPLNPEQKCLVPSDYEFGSTTREQIWWWGRSVLSLVPYYSIDVLNAFEVVDRLLQISQATFVKFIECMTEDWAPAIPGVALGHFLMLPNVGKAHFICFCALKAVGVDEIPGADNYPTR